MISVVNVPVPVPLLITVFDVVGLAVVPYTIPLARTAVPPSLVTSPPEMADVQVIPVAGVVVTVGSIPVGLLTVTAKVQPLLADELIVIVPGVTGIPLPVSVTV